MSTFENFKRTIKSLHDLLSSGQLDQLAQSIGTWDKNLIGFEEKLARKELLEAHTRLVLIDNLVESLEAVSKPLNDRKQAAQM